MSAEVSGEITAIATVVLAFFAIVTGVFAFLAYRKQSQEVRAIERQVTDQQELTKQQAELLNVQSGQLDLQRKQFDEQRKVNEQQAKVLELQADELRGSLEERKRDAEERRNAQARQVSLALKPVAEGPEGGPVGEATVSNGSQQPIYAARLSWYLSGKAHGGYEEHNPELVGTVLAGDRAARRRTFPHGANPAEPADCGAVLTFRDAAGVNWIRTVDGDIWQAWSDQVPPSVRTLLGSS
jgi:hypothetical protein